MVIAFIRRGQGQVAMSVYIATAEIRFIVVIRETYVVLSLLFPNHNTRVREQKCNFKTLSWRPKPCALKVLGPHL